MQTISSKKVLVAVRPEIREVVRLFLEPDYALTFCTTLQEAILCLDTEHYDLVFCTIRFDESRMFELLKYVKTNELDSISLTPFIAIRLRGGLFSNRQVDSMLKAAQVMGAEATVNFPEWEQEFGIADANVRLHDRLHDLGYLATDVKNSS